MSSLPDSIFAEIVTVDEVSEDFGPYRWRRWSIKPFDGATEFRRILTMADFPSTGNEEAEWIEHQENACEFCGGSGHKDDAKEAATEIASLRRELEEARLFEPALQIAHGAHDGQTDKTGAPYILHPLRVALMGECADDRVVGLLHDVVEDCPEWPLERLQPHFPLHIVEAVEALTKREGEDYAAFIDRVKTNQIAARVKMNDIADNMDPTRLSKVPPDVSARLQAKYAAAIRKLAEPE